MESYSVLMSLYQNESPDFLSASIESVLNQTVPPKQIVLVIDGPIGTELQRVVNHFSEVLDIVQLSENRGLGVALAVGLQRCTAELVARMDTDDMMLPNRASVTLQYLSSHPSIAAVGGNIAEFEISTGELGKVQRTVPQENDLIKKFAQRRNPMNHVTVMFRKQAVLAVGNYQAFQGFEDYHLWVRMLNAGYQLANLPDVIVDVRTTQKMILRRQGVRYAQLEYRFQRFMLKSRFTSRMIFFKNIVLRCGARLLPPKLLVAVYRRLLRSEAQL
ncbi:glycosyltransferase [Lactiplantibacillus nangangensis]|uniref:Glycosyltransferase n=1 Tax=Lactiplantibacillus nangangensis TaxID=2559917 RepID=A0ABW1SJL4_9LACO|nr:glycosyltransferase [Lactiplantibacillus nangangensis]